MTNHQYNTYTEALEKKSFNRLLIKRYEKECMLLIDVDGNYHVFVNKEGEKMVFRHIWQIKEMLENKFSIDTSAIPVEIKN